MPTLKVKKLLPVKNWNEQKTKLKSKFPLLTDADLNYLMKEKGSSVAQ